MGRHRLYPGQRDASVSLVGLFTRTPHRDLPRYAEAMRFTSVGTGEVAANLIDLAKGRTWRVPDHKDRPQAVALVAKLLECTPSRWLDGSPLRLYLACQISTVRLRPLTRGRSTVCLYEQVRPSPGIYIPMSVTNWPLTGRPSVNYVTLLRGRMSTDSATSLAM